MKKDSLFKGTFILSVSLILTKIIGLIYLIPYYGIIGGEKNMVLFAYAYNYYVIFLDVSSAGIPFAMTKLISKYNGKSNFEKSRRVYKLGSLILIITGIIGFLFFFFGAEFLSSITISNKDISRYSIEDLAIVMRTLSLAIPFVMINAGVRGLFQGHEFMLPSAVSQFFEQLVRVLAMLFGTYFVLKITNDNIVYANSASTFSTFLGAFFSVIILIYFIKKYYKKLQFNTDIKKNIQFEKEKDIKIIKEILMVSIPFVIVSTFFTILTLIDQNTIAKAMYHIGENYYIASELAKKGEQEFTLYSQYINKIVMISVALSPAFTGAFLPVVTRLYSQKKIKEVSTQINKVMLALLMFVIPSLVGMFVLIEPLSNLFFYYNDTSNKLMTAYLILALFYPIYGTLGIIMQAIDKQKLNILIIFIGITFKYLFNNMFIYKFETIGAIYCSILTYLILIIITISIIHKNIKINFSQLIGNFFKICLSCLLMFLITLAVYQAIIINFNIHSKIDNILIISLIGITGFIFYFVVLNKTKFFLYLFNRNINIKSFIFRRK